MPQDLDKMTIAELLETLKSEYKSNFPQMFEEYRSISPASKEEILKIEKAIREDLPEDFRTFLKLNDIRHNFQMGTECLSAQGVLDERAWMTELLDEGKFDDGRVEDHEKRGFGNWDGGFLRRCWWNRKWVPIAVDSCANITCIDLDPGMNGTRGQIMYMENQDGQGPYASSYKSFRDYLVDQVKWTRKGQPD